jgi:hypothetical protein
MKNQKEIDSFVAVTCEIGDRLDEIKAYFDNFMGLAPDEIHAGYVDSAKHCLDEVKKFQTLAHNMVAGAK